MRFEDSLPSEQKQLLRTMNKQKKPPNKKKQWKKKEHVNWPEIMGMNRDIYTRKNGAIRRK
jgi:hypothetical protein